MGFVLLKKAQMLCGIPPHSPFYQYQRVLREFVCLCHSTGTLASGVKFVCFFLVATSVGHQQK